MKQINQLIKETKKYLTKYDYDKVIELCDKILAIDNTSYFGLRFKGISYYQTGKYKVALEYYEKLYELSHDNDLINSMVFLNEKIGNYDEALKLYEKFPKIDYTFNKIKRLLTKMKNFQLIIDEYNNKINELNVLEKTPGNTKRKIVLLEEKGVFQYRNGEYNSAYESIKEASVLYNAIDYKNSYHHEKLIEWYDMVSEYLEKYQNPEDFFNELFNLEANSELWYAKINYRFSQYEDSLVFCDLLLELYSDNIDLLRVCALKSKQIDDDYSLNCWNMILEIDPENVEAIREILDIYSYQFSKDKSLNLINQKLYIDEIKMELLERKIRLLESMTLFDEAITVYDEYLSIENEDDGYVNQLSIYDKMRCMEQKSLELYLDNNLVVSYNVLKEVYNIYEKTRDSDNHSNMNSYMDDWYNIILKKSIDKSNDDQYIFFKEFYEVNNKTLELWIEKIKFLIHWKHFGNPITYCNILLNKNENNVQLLDTKAYVYYRTGRLNKALDIYNKVLKLDVENDEAKNYKFNILVQKHRYMKSYRLLKSMNVDYSIVNHNLLTLANALLKYRKYEEALYVYECIFSLIGRIDTIDKIKFLQNKTGQTEKLHNSPYYMNWIELINYKYESDNTCPKCGNKLTKIIYGYPTPETMKSADKGEIMLGGCCVSDDSPTHYCKKCNSYVHMGTYNIDISKNDKELSYYTRRNIHWITRMIMNNPKNNIKQIEKAGLKRGIDHQEIVKFIEKLVDINHIKQDENHLHLVNYKKNNSWM
ncbi:MAG: tetratricopeptide repeat protein [Methanosphaera stadtmanae]|nr:tetratricopeptide repeat protein [Methanosphaera stadtmanae]